jgi:hypothetical protein
MVILGIEDPWVAAGFILCILSSLFCAVYGLLNWNKGGHEPDKDDKDWVEEEKAIEEEI